jgi:hypothetical protein
MVRARGAVTAVMPVPVARMVMLVVPATAVPDAVNCNVVVAPVPVLGLGVNVAVTPVGRFSAVNVTSPVKFVRARAIVVDALPFTGTDNVAGVSVSPMVDDGAVMVMGSVTVWFPATGDVAVSVSVAGPNAAFDAASTVSVDVLPVAVVGESVAVTPVGAPVTVSSRSPVKPVRVMARLLVPLEPCATDSVAGVNARPIVPPVMVSVYVEPTAETPSPVATTVTGYTPATAVDATLSVTVVVDVCPFLTTSPTVAVTPAGNPVTVTPGVPLNRLPVTLTGMLAVPPIGALPLLGSSVTVSVPGMRGSSLSPHAWTSVVATRNDARSRVVEAKGFMNSPKSEATATVHRWKQRGALPGSVE